MHTPIAFGSQVVVKDETGSNQSDGPVVVVDNHVSQAVKADAPAGRYTVVWRVMSRDSHPMEGTFTFTAGSRRGTGQSGTADVPATPAPRTPRQRRALPGVWPPSAPHSRRDWQERPFTSDAGCP